MIRNKQELENLYRHYEEEMQYEIDTSETSRLRRKIIEDTDALEIELTEEQRQKLEHILETENERCGEEIKEVFIYGFALATRLLTAGLNVNAEGVTDGD